jgi:hypothetical protein
MVARVIVDAAVLGSPYDGRASSAGQDDRDRAAAGQQQ